MEAEDERPASSLGNMRSFHQDMRNSRSPCQEEPAALAAPMLGTRRQSLPTLSSCRRPSILYEENMPVIVRQAHKGNAAIKLRNPWGGGGGEDCSLRRLKN